MKLSLPFRMIFVMVLITAASGFVLSGVWSVSVDKIRFNEKLMVEEALTDMNPTKARYEIVSLAEGVEVFKCFDAADVHLSYFFLASGNGFQDKIKLAVTMDPQLERMLGMRVLEQKDTPGLGAKITEPVFTDKFTGLATQVGAPLTCIKVPADKIKGEVQAITGATISSKAVLIIINEKLSQLRKAGL